MPYEKPKFLIYWTLLCDQVYGQDTGSKTVNFSHFGHHFQQGNWRKWPKLTEFDPVSWPYTWSHTKVQNTKNFAFSWGKNIFLPLGPVTCSVFPEFAILSKIRVKKVGFCSHSKTSSQSTLESFLKFSLCPKLLKNGQNSREAKTTFGGCRSPKDYFPNFLTRFK